MGLFGRQLANVVEWEEFRDDVIFWKWTNREIKKGSRLVIRPGQDAIFMYNGVIEGIFKDEGSFDVESDIIPFLSTLKGFKFGFNSGMRAEVLFVNTKEFTVKWGTRNPIPIPMQSLPGGLPVRAFGTFNFKVSDYIALIDKVAGVKQIYAVDDVRERVVGVLDQLLIKWISKAGTDMFNLQANASEIANGIRQDLDMEMSKLGIEITGFNIASFNYPEEVVKMQNKAASHAMVGDMDRYTKMAMTDNIGKVSGGASHIASDMMSMQMGMAMGQKMMDTYSTSMNSSATGTNAGSSAGTGIKFCPECGHPAEGAKFCSNCGKKLM